MPDTTPLHPELAPAGQDIDGPALTYRAAADALNGATHGVRTLAGSHPVTGDQLDTRLDALDQATSALLVALATLRDAHGAEAVTDQLTRAVGSVYEAGQHLTTARQLLGPATPEDDE